MRLKNGMILNQFGRRNLTDATIKEVFWLYYKKICLEQKQKKN